MSDEVETRKGELTEGAATQPSAAEQIAATTAANRKHKLEYTHTVCETDGKMSPEVEARFYGDPENVTSLYCTKCGVGIRIGEDGEMVWKGGKDKVVPGVLVD